MNGCFSFVFSFVLSAQKGGGEPYSSSWQTQLMVPVQERISRGDFLALVPHVRPGIKKSLKYLLIRIWLPQFKPLGRFFCWKSYLWTAEVKKKNLPGANWLFVLWNFLTYFLHNFQYVLLRLYICPSIFFTFQQKWSISYISAHPAKTMSLLGKVRTEMNHKTVWKNKMHLFKIISLILEVSNTFCAIFPQTGNLDWDKIHLLKFSHMWEISSTFHCV